MLSSRARSPPLSPSPCQDDLEYLKTKKMEWKDSDDDEEDASENEKKDDETDTKKAAKMAAKKAKGVCMCVCRGGGHGIKLD